MKVGRKWCARHGSAANKKWACSPRAAPHRPNHLGLSLLKLERIETGKPVRLYCSGSDLLDGTPIVDIKLISPLSNPNPMPHPVSSAANP
ncbi:TPA: TrmO family methyltransferase [Neisseria gonorrhoeae]